MSHFAKPALLITALALLVAACGEAQKSPPRHRGHGKHHDQGGLGPMASQTSGRSGVSGGSSTSSGPGRTWDIEQIGSSSQRTNTATTYAGAPSVTMTLSGDTRLIESNNLPDHRVGSFPNGSVEAQSNTYRMDATPSQNAEPTYLRLGTSFGIALNGVTFDPLAAEFYEKGGRDWNYVALDGAIPLGLDSQNGHIQPGGKYHYHGLATDMGAGAGFDASAHSNLIGYAADGFPIYALYGYANGQSRQGVAEMTSSWRLKSGSRPGGSDAPGGTYDGTFHADYEYVAGAGTLDACNGLQTQTPDFPDGTYAYFLTAAYPVVPLCHRGTPDASFSQGNRSGGDRRR